MARTWIGFKPTSESTTCVFVELFTLIYIILCVGKLGGTIEKTEEKQIGNVIVREMKEGRNLPTLFSSPLIKIRVFNWSKLI